MNQYFDIHVLKNAVYESASTIKDLRKGVKVFSKKHEVDLVTEADLRSEEILVNAIKKEFPNDGIISEERLGHNIMACLIFVPSQSLTYLLYQHHLRHLELNHILHMHQYFFYKLFHHQRRHQYNERLDLEAFFLLNF